MVALFLVTCLHPYNLWKWNSILAHETCSIQTNAWIGHILIVHSYSSKRKHGMGWERRYGLPAGSWHHCCRSLLLLFMHMSDPPRVPVQDLPLVCTNSWHDVVEHCWSLLLITCFVDLIQVICVYNYAGANLVDSTWPHQKSEGVNKTHDFEDKILHFWTIQCWEK